MSFVSSIPHRIGRSPDRRGWPLTLDRWSATAQMLVLVLLCVALFSGPLLQLVEVRERNGYLHVEYARQIAETHVLYPGHFLYHVLTVAVHGIAPVSWLQAHFIVVVALRALLAVVLWNRVRISLRAGSSASDALLTIAASLSLMVVSAISILTWGQENYYLGYIVPNVYVSQTMLALQPFALLTFFAVVAVLYAPPPGPSGRMVGAMAAFAVLSTLAKPSFVIALLPAVALLVLWERRLRDVKLVLTLAVGLALPVLVAIIWVYGSTYLVVQQVALAQDTGFRLAPFQVMAGFQRERLGVEPVAVWLVAKFFLSILFPLTVTAGYFSKVRRDSRLVFAWLLFAVGLLFTYIVAEYPSSGAGNFTWSGHITLFVLFVVCALFLFEQTVAGAQSRRRAVVSNGTALLCYVAFFLHLVGGLALYLNPTVR